MDGERKRRCIATSPTCHRFTVRTCMWRDFARKPGRLSKRCTREKNGYVTVQRNGCQPFSIRSTSFLFPFKVRSFPCFLNGPPVKRNG